MHQFDYKKLLEKVCSSASGYLDSVDQQPVFPDLQSIDALRGTLDAVAPNDGKSPEQVLEFIDRFIAPATVASTGGRYFVFVTGGTLPAALAANWMASAMDQNSFGAVSSPAIHTMESVAMDWLRQVLNLPENSVGTLVTGATMANFTCLAAARHRVLANVGWDVAADGLFGAPEINVIVGAEAHSSLYKVLGMLGMGRERVLRVEADDQGRMRADKLPSTEGPTIVCLQAGNVNSGAFDPAEEIISRVDNANTWFHVDGAFGLWARASKTLYKQAEGLEAAHSWATDAHKWLNVPYDGGAAFVKDSEALKAAMSQSGAYLMLGGEHQAIDITPDSSRRARALDVWAALYHLGRKGVSELIDRNCAQARSLARGLV